MSHKNKLQKGFALLITLVVVSVVLAIGLSLLFVTTKQYLLAITANESEKAFQAAQIGLECMRFHRAQTTTRAKLLADDTSAPWPPPLACAGVTASVPGDSQPVLPAAGDVKMYRYQYQYTVNDSCIDTSMYIADYRDSTSGSPYNISSQNEGLTEIECTAGSLCTVIFSRGYNRPCGQLNSIFTIQREITVEY